MTRARTYDDVPVRRALDATDAEHRAAIADVRCAICGAEPGEECLYGALAILTYPGTRFPGRAHTRRVRAYLATLPVEVLG